jgi:lipid II:glycine glycyltransferase (peptidoglycan interpeptide bridge formation enzyme)
MRALPADEGAGPAWDELLRRLPVPHLLQGATWGSIKRRWGWTVHRFAWGASGRETAAVQVLVRPVGRLPLSVAYASKGPLLAEPANPAAWSAVLPDLESWARRAGVALLKVDADVPAGATAVAELWRERGWRPSAEQIQFRNTMVSSLGGGEEALLARMKAKTRYNVRLARRRGVVVRPLAPAELDALYDLYLLTAQRGGFAIRTRAYYLDLWTTFLERDAGVALVAERDGQPLAGVFSPAFGDTAWYLHGASADDGREHMPAYLAQWESLRWAVARGCRRYDWWGGPDALDAADPLWGVYRFKEGFGAEWVEQLGAWDFPADPLRFALYRRLAAMRHRLLDLRRGGP